MKKTTGLFATLVFLAFGTTIGLATAALLNSGKSNQITQVGPKGEKGDKGDTGETGPQGEQGIQGEKGDTGATGPQGPQGEKGDKVDTGEQGPQGEKGDAGETGAQGPQGEQGIQGEKGDKGDTGEQGPQGEKGDAGEKGETGAQGPQGEKGDKGDTGDQGIQGEKGDKGDTGDQGPQGEKGDKGDTGEQGPQGEKGDKGDDGLQGEKTWSNTILPVTGGYIDASLGSGIEGAEVTFSFVPTNAGDIFRWYVRSADGVVRNEDSMLSNTFKTTMVSGGFVVGGEVIENPNILFAKSQDELVNLPIADGRNNVVVLSSFDIGQLSSRDETVTVGGNGTLSDNTKVILTGDIGKSSKVDSVLNIKGVDVKLRFTQNTVIDNLDFSYWGSSSNKGRFVTEAKATSFEISNSQMEYYGKNMTNDNVIYSGVAGAQIKLANVSLVGEETSANANKIYNIVGENYVDKNEYIKSVVIQDSTMMAKTIGTFYRIAPDFKVATRNNTFEIGEQGVFKIGNTINGTGASYPALSSYNDTVKVSTSNTAYTSFYSLLETDSTAGKEFSNFNIIANRLTAVGKDGVSDLITSNSDLTAVNANGQSKNNKYALVSISTG